MKKIFELILNDIKIVKIEHEAYFNKKIKYFICIFIFHQKLYFYEKIWQKILIKIKII